MIRFQYEKMVADTKIISAKNELTIPFVDILLCRVYSNHFFGLFFLP